ncbi:MAG TPA: SGNH/GDSL hydrolase family protein [Anaerolineales bacterium]
MPGLILSSCAHTASMTNPPPTAPGPDPVSNRYLALGDSYTIGESVAYEDRFPIQLTDALVAQDVLMDAPLIIARTGWTTAELSAAIDQAQPNGPFDLVTLLIGVNNQYRGYDIEEYRLEFRELLQRAIAFAGGDAVHVIVVSIPDWGVTPYAAGRDPHVIAGEIDAYNAVNFEETAQTDARYVDVTAISRNALQDPALIAADGLHPSGKMYAQWVEQILPEAIDVLKK